MRREENFIFDMLRIGMLTSHTSLPIDIILQESTARYNIRIGTNAIITNVETECSEKKRKNKLSLNQ